MRKFWLSVVLMNILLFTLTVAANTLDRSIDTLYPQLGNVGYDVQHYDIDLHIADDLRYITAMTTIDLIATQTLEAFMLDFQGLTITNVTVEGQPALYSRIDSKIVITPKEPLVVNQPATVQIAYEGTPRASRNSGASTPRGWNRATRGRVYVVSQPDGASTWFPANDHPTDKATVTLHVDVASRWQVVAGGQLERIVPTSRGFAYTYSHDVPVATYLVALNIGDFVSIEGQTATGLPLQSYAPTTLGIEQFRPRIDQLDEMIAFFSDLYGTYPFASYGIVVEPAFSNANEMQTLPVFHPTLVTEQVMVHELAHQWFGNHVSVGDWSHLWLSEGFATYSEYLWYESQGRADTYTLISEAGYNYVRTLPPPLAMRPEVLFPATIYHRGAWTLHALRLRVGDDAFFEILRTFYAEYGGSHAYTEDFIAIAERISGESLAEFFEGWLSAPQPPPLLTYR